MLKLEGGTDDDLVVLDCPGTPPPERGHSSSNPLMSPRDDDMAESSAEGKKKENISHSTEPLFAGNKRKEGWFRKCWVLMVGINLTKNYC